MLRASVTLRARVVLRASVTLRDCFVLRACVVLLAGTRPTRRRRATRRNAPPLGQMPATHPWAPAESAVSCRERDVSVDWAGVSVEGPGQA
ncbi:hypothetical protein GCM10009591_33660 [Brachybacterium tyrofermentans]